MKRVRPTDSIGISAKQATNFNNLKKCNLLVYGGSAVEYNVMFQWDPEASVWIATSDDVPGLVLESGSIDALIERVKMAIPELLELNNVKMVQSVRFNMCKTERLYA